MTNAPTSAGAPRRPSEVALPSRLEHLPRDPRGYPIIVTVPQAPGDVDFGAISEMRKLVVATYDLCAICGHPFGEDLRWQVHPGADDPASALPALMNEAPVHKRCGLYAAQVCPFVSSPYARLSDDMRRGQRRGAVVELLGFRATADVTAVASDLQQGVHILAFEMADLVEVIRLHNADEAKRAYETELQTDTAIELDEQTQALVTQLSTPVDDEDAAGVLAGAAYILGAAFLEKVDQVQGMGRFGGPTGSYFRIAVGLAHDSTAFEGLKDPHTVAAIRWLNTRTELPVVLERWRQSGRRSTRLVARDGRAPGAPAPRPPASNSGRKRKAQRAARRKNRR